MQINIIACLRKFKWKIACACLYKHMQIHLFVFSYITCAIYLFVFTYIIYIHIYTVTHIHTHTYELIYTRIMCAYDIVSVWGVQRFLSPYSLQSRDWRQNEKSRELRPWEYVHIVFNIKEKKQTRVKRCPVQYCIIFIFIDDTSGDASFRSIMFISMIIVGWVQEK